VTVYAIMDIVLELVAVIAVIKSTEVYACSASCTTSVFGVQPRNVWKIFHCFDVLCRAKLLHCMPIGWKSLSIPRSWIPKAKITEWTTGEISPFLSLVYLSACDLQQRPLVGLNCISMWTYILCQLFFFLFRFFFILRNGPPLVQYGYLTAPSSYRMLQNQSGVWNSELLSSTS